MRAVVICALLAGCSLIVDPTRSSDTLVNSTTQEDQSNPSVAFANERYLAVWDDESQAPPDTSGKSIRGRFVSEQGLPLTTDDFLINSPETSRLVQERPRVAANGAGMFVVVWTDLSGIPAGDSDSAIKGRWISSTGGFEFQELRINTTVANQQSEASLVATGSDSFMVVWTDASRLAPDTEERAIRGRLIGGDGTAIQPTDRVINSTTIGDQAQPAIARGRDGRLLVVWRHTTNEIRGRILMPDGTDAGDDFRVNSTMTGEREAPFVVATMTGYVVLWTDASGTTGDLDGSAVRARRLDFGGKPLGDGDFALNTTTAGDQGRPSAVMHADGSIFVAFEDASRDTNDVRARRLDVDGMPTLGDDFPVNSIGELDQEDVAVAANPGGGVLVVWEDASTAEPDGSANGIRARRFPPPALTR